MNAAPKHLILLRHASAQNDASDRARPLSEQGRGEAIRTGEALGALGKRGFRPALLLTSPARRARETVAGIHGALAGELRVEEDETLYLASPGQLLDRLQALPEGERQVLLVGHNPGLAELVQLLVERAPAEVLLRASRGLAPASFAALRIDGARWRDLAPGCAELVEFLRPGDR
ncbi:MAG: histidine phosphatase family protein [Myxococcota bacterium]